MSRLVAPLRARPLLAVSLLVGTVSALLLAGAYSLVNRAAHGSGLQFPGADAVFTSNIAATMF